MWCGCYRNHQPITLKIVLSSAANQIANTGFTCDPNGNLTSVGVNPYTWDRANRLTGMAGLTYTYDGAGNRISQSNGVDVTKYLLDLQPGLPLMVAQNKNGNTDRFVHLPGRGIFAQEDHTGPWQDLLLDGLGSTRIVVDDTDQVVSYQSYTPVGVPLESGFGSPFTFTGEMLDANDLLYLRARYYSPVLGVFTALDPLENGNRYQYVGANPTNWTDPSGKKGEKCGGIIGNGSIEIRRMDRVPNPELYLVGTNDVEIPDGLHPSDANQGWLNNCSFVGALAAFAVTAKGRDKIKSSIRNNHDGTFEVTLYLEREFLGQHIGWNKETFHVIPEVPVIVDSNTCAEINQDFHIQIDDIGANNENEVWALVLENAWALYAGDGDKAKGYLRMETEDVDERDIMQALTRSQYKTKNPSDVDFEDLRRWHIDEQRPVIFGSFDEGDKEIKKIVANDRYGPYQLVPNHTYYLYDVNETSQRIVIRNPWGWANAPIEMPIEDVQKYFENVYVADGGFN